jgi:surfeit locus 1 family protein
MRAARRATSAPVSFERDLMMRRLILPLLFGVLGTVVLVVLGTWQLQRLHWKEAIIARIEAQLAADPVGVPEGATPEAHQYLRVAEEGVIGEEELHVYTSIPPYGVGYRVIAPFDLADGRRILLDRGFIPREEKATERAGGPALVEGALHWPQETDYFTPEPDRATNIWFARNTDLMAHALGAKPVMLVAERVDPATPPMPTPIPVSVNIPNNHLEYVVTWYGLAIVWAGMTLYWVWRMGQRPEEKDEGVRQSP